MGDSAAELNFMREDEFPQLKDNIYLDHAGSTLYASRQINAFAEQAKSRLFANPHSGHAPSQKTSMQVDKVRNRILQFFNTDSAHYSIVFTSGATAAMKLTAESFDFGPAGAFAHLREVHTSVLGMAAVARARKTVTVCFREEDIHTGDFFRSTDHLAGQSGKLVVFPGQCNFSGRKYPLEWIKVFSAHGWKVFLDGASLVATSGLDLTDTQPHFVALSFYKIFGFPTGLGALLVRKDAEACLKKTYFGGGAVDLAVGENGFHVFRSDFTRRMEDGTLPFLDIIALNHGFDVIDTLAGGIREISRHTFALAYYTSTNLQQLRHGNGIQAVEVYSWDVFSKSNNQGPIVAFNLRDHQGRIIGFTAVERVAESFNLHLRTGCFCNTGACQKYLGLTTESLIANFHAGHVCGDSRDLIGGKPTGAVRVSFGYMSTKSDADSLLALIKTVFVDLSSPVGMDIGGNMPAPNRGIDAAQFLTDLFIYPVKSCRGKRVSQWPLGEEGFLYDRRYFIQNSAGTSITLKHNSKLRDIFPSVSLPLHQMSLTAPGASPLVISLINSDDDQADSDDDSTARNVPDILDSRVCGRPILAVDCGAHTAQWLSDYLQDDVYSLKCFHGRQESAGGVGTNFPSSAANFAPFLLICSASLDALLNALPVGHAFTREDLIQRMRPNLVVQTSVPFQEDLWSTIKIGDVVFEVMEKCSRCQMINISGLNGQRTSEPLQTIIRLRGKEMNFGVLLRQISPTNASLPFTLQEKDRLTIVTSLTVSF